MQVLRLCFSCALLACTISISVQQSIQISTIPSPLIFLATRTFQLSCMYNPSQHTFQHWVHPSGTQLSSSSGRFTVRSPNAGTTRLIVAQSEQSDEGTYYCVFQTTQGTSDSRSMVAQFRRHVTISTPDNSVYTVTVGNAVSLLCDAQYQNITQWQDSQRIVVSNSSDGRVQIRGTSLFFQRVGLGDNGTYYCVVSNERSVLTLTAHLYVHESPSVTITPPSAIVNPSDSTTFTCEARGSPRPSIIWTNEETGSLEVSPFLSKEPETVSEYVVRTRLIFPSVREQDTGTYRCAASNSAGSASSTATLQLIGTPSAPPQVELSLVNFTSINVTWLHPIMDGNAPIVSYTVMWLMASSSNGRAFSHTLEGPTLQTHYLITNLQPVTVYTVLVHASNQEGRGRDSEEVNITTNATVPGAPLEVTFRDVAPTSVQVEWILPSNDGGTPITSIQVYYRTENQPWGEAQFEEITSLDSSSLMISNLRVDTWYQLQVVVKNRIGFGPPRDSTPFRTPPPGFPASPSHITVRNITDTTAIICWVPRNVGRPFVSYNIHAIVNSSSQENGIVQTKQADEIFRQLPNCTEGAQITGLMQGTCYTFTVAISNNQGLGQPSAGLDVCTSSTPVCVNNVCTQCTEDGVCAPIAQSSQATGLTSEIIAVLVICAVIGVVLLVVAVLLLWKISSTLRHQKSHTFPNLPPPSETIRRESSRSDKVLLEYDREQQSAQRQFQKQFSIGNSSSVSSQNSVSDQDTPNTATTLMSEKSPFSFTPPIAVHVGTGMEYPRSASLGSMGRSFHIYPIPEHAPAHPCIPPEAHPHPHTLPNQWQIHPYPISNNLHQQNCREEFEMIENPSNRQFEEEKQAELEGKMVNFSHEVEDPEDEIPPPVPPYRGEDMVDDPSLRPPLTAPPYLGESFSQPSHSPRLQHNNCEFYIPSNEEEDMEFIDNDAYEKISPQPMRRHPPRFEIKGQKRGAIFETVDLRH